MLCLSTKGASAFSCLALYLCAKLVIMVICHNPCAREEKRRAISRAREEKRERSELCIRRISRESKRFGSRETHLFSLAPYLFSRARNARDRAPLLSCRGHFFRFSWGPITGVTSAALHNFALSKILYLFYVYIILKFVIIKNTKKV